MNYKPSGVCSTNISFDLKDGKIYNLVFTNGCNGNLKAISKLLEGRDAQEIITLFKGNTCKSRPTSCADQLSKALEKALEGASPPPAPHRIEPHRLRDGVVAATPPPCCAEETP
jgi:uncharacterized protein (TIGR03905 family)